MRTCWVLAVALVVAARLEARASEGAKQPAAASIVVDLGAGPGARPWLADAFEQDIARELSGFERLAVVAKEDLATSQCGADTGCRLRVYKTSHIDIVCFGQVSDSEIHYELYQTWTPARLATGVIAIGRGQSPIGLKHEIRGAFRSVLKHGGLLDQRPYMYSARESSSSWTAIPPWILLAALALAVMPFALLAAVTRSVRGIARLGAARRAALVIAALALACAADAMLGHGTLGALVAWWPWGFAGLGGLAWGALAIRSVRGLLPPLDGLGRVAHHDVWRLIRTWCVVVGQRLAVLAALYAALVALALRIGDALSVPDPWPVVVLVPVTFGLARLWLASWIECLAVVLDARFVDGAASTANPWSREIADYLMGYVRRTGWDIDRELLARIVFLPGKRADGRNGVDAVVAYGGGATHARIVVDKALLELAMGELIEVKPEDKPALWPDWTAAMVAPAPGARVRRAAGAGTYRGRKPRAASHVIVRKPLGQAATLLGYVIAAPGQRVPLISDNPSDLAVVRELLSEHYPWDAPDPDDEFDATDPTDKDFLFGALVREIGVIQRQDCQLQTVKLALGRWLVGVSSRGAARLADAYPALNFARDHLIQYLFLRWSGSAELLTARARPHQLHETSTRLLGQLVPAAPAEMSPAPPSPAPRVRRAMRRRLVWMSRFFAEPIVDRRDIWTRRLLVAGSIAAVVAAAGVLASRSIEYHRIYSERIEAEQRAFAERTEPQDHKEAPPHGETQAH